MPEKNKIFKLSTSHLILKKVYNIILVILSILILNLHFNQLLKIYKINFWDIINEILKENNIIVIFYWVFLLTISIILIDFISKKFSLRKIIKRKLFHFLICLIYLPALKYMYIQILLLISTFILYIFLLIEVLRNKFKNIQVFKKISEYLINNIDDRDDARFILTHTFLLFGCFSSIVFEELNCSGNKINLKYFIGLISLGIGDSFVNYI